MKHKDIAISIFNRIGDGHNNAVRRPDDEKIDRHLRRLISKANENGDVIVSGGNGYYRPIPGDVVDDMEYNIYMAQEQKRIDSLCIKSESMRIAYVLRRLEVGRCSK